MPQIAARVGQSHTLKQGNASQQPSSFGALLFVTEVSQERGITPNSNCLRSIQVTMSHKFKADFFKDNGCGVIALNEGTAMSIELNEY